MPVVTRRELLEAGVHFGHQTRRWNPKMHRYLYGERSGIYIIDLEKSLSGIEETYEFVRGLGRRRGIVLFIGTKKQAQEVVAGAGEPRRHALREPPLARRHAHELHRRSPSGCSACASSARWSEPARSTSSPRRRRIRLRHEREKLERNLGGIQDLERLPDAVFVIDTKKEHIAVNEARKLDIPVIAIVDTNCDPDEVDFVIPGNDDAIRAVNLVTRVIADALAEGYGMAKDEIVEKRDRPGPARAHRRQAHRGPRGRRRDPVARGRRRDRRDHRVRARRAGPRRRRHGARARRGHRGRRAHRGRRPPRPTARAGRRRRPTETPAAPEPAAATPEETA